jgi:hypothetical protein
MTAEPHRQHSTPQSWPERNPRAILAALLPEDRPRFAAEFREVMATAAEELELTPVTACLERWRRVAASSIDPVAHRGMLDRAEQLLGDQDVPTTSWGEIRTRLGA